MQYASPFQLPGAAAESVILPVLQAGVEILFGPIFIPGASVCPRCTAHRLATAMHEEWRTPALSDERIIERLRGWAYEFALSGRLPELETCTLAFNTLTGAISHHTVLPIADCPRCAPLVAGATSLRLHCSRLTGIVNAMELSAAPVAGAWRAAATWSSPPPSEDARPHLMRQESYGRGASAQQAEDSCIGEALERYSLIYRGDEKLHRTRYSDVDAIHPADMLLYSESQYRTRAPWNSTAEECLWVPAPFDPDAESDWMPATSLNRPGDIKYVAAACCLMWYQFRRNEPEFASADTIGCGAGRTFEDALSHALLEWVERDAIAIWWDNRLRRPAIRLHSFESKALNETAEGLRALGRDLFLLDCTTDIGIPAFVAVAPRFDGSEPLVAAAAHLSAHTAACKAATEAGQVWFEARRTGTMYEGLVQWLLNETTATQPYMRPSGFVDAPPEFVCDAEVEVPTIVSRLTAAGLESYAIDHSRSDVILKTARAIVPGLRHIWNRRAPGRLYDVPVKMGWLPTPTPEEDLNPIRCTL